MDKVSSRKGNRRRLKRRGLVALLSLALMASMLPVQAFAEARGELSAANTSSVPVSSERLAPGTYTATANLSVPGSENDVLKGKTVYLTNPKNPLAGLGSPQFGLPTSPMVGNATLVATEDGRCLVDIPLPNAAFTLVDFGESPAGVAVLGIEREGAKGRSTQARIVRAVLEVPASGVSDAAFLASHIYAAPLDADKSWTVLLTVDTASVEKVSSSTTIDIPGLGADPGSGPGSSGAIPDNSGNDQGTDSAGASGTVRPDGSESAGSVAAPTEPNGSQVPTAPAPSTPSTTVTGGKEPTSAAAAGSAADAQATRLTEGTYTVTCNIWSDKEATGLPLNPHFTSDAFPPKDPVADNAKLRVDGAGRCTVTVPISIQPTVLKVNSVSGLAVVDSSSAEGALSSITVDLGVLSPRDTVVKKTCTLGVTMGDLAGVISGVTGQQSWPATFQLNFTGVPASGGGTVPPEALAAMESTEGATDAQDAAAAALAALEETTVIAEGAPTTAAVAEDGTPLAETAADGTAIVSALSPEALGNALASHPWIAFGLGVLSALAAGAIAFAVRRWHRLRATAGQ